jgi:hypothetical protein
MSRRYKLIGPKSGAEKEKEDEERRRRGVFLLPCCFFLLLGLLLAIVVTVVVLVIVLAPSATAVVLITNGTTIVPATTTIPSTTTTGITTTTSVPTTLPFDLNCHFTDYYGELEETTFPINATVSGMGCNNTAVTFSEEILIGFMKRGEQEQQKRVLPRTPAMDCNLMVIPPSNLTTEIHPVLVNTTIFGSKRKLRDIGTFPTNQMTYNPFYSFQGEGFMQQQNEYYQATDNDNFFMLTVPVFQTGFYRTFEFATSIVNIWDLGALFPPPCYDVMMQPYAPVALRFDHEAQKYVMVILNGDYMCVAVSNTNDPRGMWGLVQFNNATFSTYISALEFGIWKDYYNICWLENNMGKQHCVILQRNETLTLSSPKVAFVVGNLFPIDNPATVNVPAVHPLHQGLSTRATFAPCGAFAVANDQRQQFQMMFCETIDFNTEIATFSSYYMNTSWTSGWDYPCNAVLNGGCIESTDFPGQPLQTFSNRLRMAYYNYGTHEKLAYIWQAGLGLGPTKLLWGELYPSQVITQQSPLSPGIMDGGDLYYFAPAISYDCRESLFITFTQTSNITSINQDFTYRLRTDPPNQIRYPLQVDYGPFWNIFPTTPNWLMPQSIPNTQNQRTARFSVYTSFNPIYAEVQLQTEIIQRTYTASDVCNNTISCTQNIYLGTIANCSTSLLRCDNATYSFLMNAPPLSPQGAQVMYYNNSVYYASGNRGVILTGQYLWPINEDSLVLGDNLYPMDYPWEDQITGMGYWANGNRFIFAERQYAHLWSTNVTGGDVQLLMKLDRERRGLAIVGDLAYLPSASSSGQPFRRTVQEIALNNNTVLRNISASDAQGLIEVAYGTATHPLTGDIWIVWSSSTLQVWIGTFNPQTGYCRRICGGPVFFGISGISFDSKGRLWFVTGGGPPGPIYRFERGTPCIC